MILSQFFGAIVSALVFLTLFKNGEAISCYICDSVSNQNCTLDFATVGLTECVGGATNRSTFLGIETTKSKLNNVTEVNSLANDSTKLMACYEFTENVSGREEVARGCVNKELGTIYCDERKNDKVVISCKICDHENGCNSSSTMAFDIITMSLSFILTLCLSRLR